jgi:hypothetical protein
MIQPTNSNAQRSFSTHFGKCNLVRLSRKHSLVFKFLYLFPEFPIIIIKSTDFDFILTNAFTEANWCYRQFFLKDSLIFQVRKIVQFKDAHFDLLYFSPLLGLITVYDQNEADFPQFITFHF